MRTLGVCFCCPTCGLSTETVRLTLDSARRGLIRGTFQAFDNAADPRPRWDADRGPRLSTMRRAAAPRAGRRRRDRWRPAADDL